MVEDNIYLDDLQDGRYEVWAYGEGIKDDSMYLSVIDGYPFRHIIVPRVVEYVRYEAYEGAKDHLQRGPSPLWLRLRAGKGIKMPFLLVKEKGSVWIESRKLFVLNSPILTAYGGFDFEKISEKKASYMLRTEAFESAVGHAATATYLSHLLEVEIPAQRIEVRMMSGDRAIVFRLLDRLPEGVVLQTENDVLHTRYELGLLTML